MNLRNKINGVKEIWQFNNRWHLLFNRLFFSKEKINIYNYKGLEILIDHSAGDANGAREVLTSNMYRKYINLIKFENKINVLDLGTNNGGFPLLIKSENIDINKLVCVELNPLTFSRMRFNIERNLNCVFIPLNMAICGESKEINVNFGNASTSDNIYNSDINDGNSFYKIKGVTFNEVYNETFQNEIIDICKIDIEGAEFEVFENENSDLIKNCRYILIEIHHNAENSRENIRNKLIKMNFEEIEGNNKSDNLHYVHFFQNLKL